MNHLTACITLLALCSAPMALQAAEAPPLPPYDETVQLQGMAMAKRVPVPVTAPDHLSRLQLSILATTTIPVPQARPQRPALAQPTN